jgi:hypothetical protein
VYAEDPRGLFRLLHDLRHGTMSLWAAAGVPLELASKMAGHASYSFSADRYQHVFAETASRAADAIWSLVRAPNVPTSFPQGTADGERQSLVTEDDQVKMVRHQGLEPRTR